MEDKQKQIEEMAKDLNAFFDKTPMELSFNHDNGKVDIIKEKQALKVLDNITRQALIPVFAECLTDLGYRKIPENAVVLTEEEQVARDYERYNLGYETHKQESKKREDYIETLSHHINDLENAILIARKETAEKFAERLKAEYDAIGEKLLQSYDEVFGSDLPEWSVPDVVNSYGYIDKIDGICKEIAEGKV